LRAAAGAVEKLVELLAMGKMSSGKDLSYTSAGRISNL
jgi:hypothetical protein